MRVFLFLAAMFFLLPVQADSIGIITTSVGEVSWLRGDAELLLRRGDAVEIQDQVNTGEDARVVMRMNDGSLITLGGDTTMVFSHWDYQAGSGESSAQLELMEGAFRFVTGLVTKQADPDLTVMTPSGNIGVRGTDFWGGYLDADALDVILLDGEHMLEISNRFGMVYIQQPGYGVTIPAGKKPDEPVQWGKAKLDRAVQTIALPK